MDAVKERKHQLVNDSSPESSAVVGFSDLKELPKSLKRLFINPTYMLVSFGGVCEGLIMAGLGAFLPKILEQQFGLIQTQVAIVLGT